jgi:hypothetical protein
MRTRKIVTLAAVVAFASAATYAAVIFDPDTGTGFVGKGDVQLVFGWNNKALQDNAEFVEFQVHSVSETTWTCSRTEPQEQTRNRHRTTTTQGVVSNVARERNQITGFILDGYIEDPIIEGDGHSLESCGGGGFVYDEGSEETTVIGGGLEVRAPGFDWTVLE